MPRTARSSDAAETPSRTASTVREIERMIYGGALEPGAALDERGLAARLGVSRTPVREALQQLQVRGLVSVVPRQGAFVRRISIIELRNLLEALQELEVVIARFAARRIDAPGRERLLAANVACARVAADNDHAGYLDANIAFHEVLYGAAGNLYITEQVKLIRQRTDVYRRGLFEKTDRLLLSAAEHEALTQTVVGGDAGAAEAIMRRHILVGGAGFAELVSTIPPGLLRD